MYLLTNIVLSCCTRNPVQFPNLLYNNLSMYYSWHTYVKKKLSAFRSWKLVFWSAFTFRFDFHHEKATTRANLVKSKNILRNTTTASRSILNWLRICINWNPPFKQTSLHTTFNEVNLALQRSHLEVGFFLKGGFQLMQILDLLYFLML